MVKNPTLFNIIKHGPYVKSNIDTHTSRIYEDMRINFLLGQLLSRTLHRRDNWLNTQLMDVLLTNSGYFNVLNVSSVSKLGCSASIKCVCINPRLVLTITRCWLWYLNTYLLFTTNHTANSAGVHKAKFIYQPYRIIV